MYLRGMSQFIVSARKYRPTHFDEVVGQQHVTDTLKNAIREDHLAHAFLFCGPRGVGKTTCARILAKVLNCSNLDENYRPCNECSSCVSFNDNASFNITELDAASNNSVEHIRTLIEQVRFQPQQGKYRIFIIDEVHMLSQQAFNAFLKTLEEPPSYAIFILATTERHKILPTILSRCQIFDFRRIQVADIMPHLENICSIESIKAEEEALNMIAHKADGALRDALSIFDRIVSHSGSELTYQQVIDNLNILDYEYFFRLTDFIISSNLQETLLLFDEVLKNGFDPEIFTGGLAEHFRNLLVSKHQNTKPLLSITGEIANRYHSQANIIDSNILLTSLKILSECDIQLKTARNQRLLVEMALIQLTSIAFVQEGKNMVAAEKKNLIPNIIADTEVSYQTKQAEEPTPKKQSLAQKPTIVGDNKPVVTEKSSSPVTNIEKTTSFSSPKPKGKLQKKLNRSASGLSLNSIKKEAIEDNNLRKSFKPITLENITKEWNTFAETIQSPSYKAYMKNAELKISESTLHVKLPSNIARNTIMGDASLSRHLHENFENIVMVIDVDEEKLKEQQIAMPKVAGPQEIFKSMSDKNPHLKLLGEKLGLKYDAK